MPNLQLATTIDRLMRRLHVRIQAKASDFDKENLGPTGSMVLLTLDEIGTAPLHKLTERMQRDKSQMTRMVRQLEQKGLVTRQPSSEDARVTLLALTPSGCEVVLQVQQEVAEPWKRCSRH
ncbi:MarR family winged helix-turn-helix transcriptional regulator [Thalassobius sp. MITS945101]|uniref:MarR family winged helix-turn-helix transcriptional regulator n=1 Tax=Thalassobius sp. MITS945101 TaxID=3096994 RepID=UPI00399BE3AE